MPHNEHSYKIKGSKEVKLGLIGEKYTSFLLFRCDCGHPIAFPQMNLDIALAEGTEETIKILKELGLALKELEDDKDYPWRASLTKVARCGMCQNCIGLGEGCRAGHGIVYPLINGEHACPDYKYLPDIINIREPKFPECELCSHWFMGTCIGIEWHSIRTRSICEIYRDARTICEHAIPTLQYGNHIRNNYCTLPPDQRDGDAKAGWKWMCPNAHNSYTEHLKCYKAKG